MSPATFKHAPNKSATITSINVNTNFCRKVELINSDGLLPTAVICVSRSCALDAFLL